MARHVAALLLCVLPIGSSLVVGACSIDTASPLTDAAAPLDAEPLDANVVDDALVVGAGGDADTTGDPIDICQGGDIGLGSDMATTRIIGYGFIELDSPASVAITEMTTILVVPTKPPASGTVFLWPGIQPLTQGANYLPIDNGVLQPVLTWGPTCAPNAPASSYASWWVSAQYVNTVGMSPGFTGCLGGAGMLVSEGDSLLMTLKLSGTTWSQTVTDLATNESVSYDIDLEGQAQSRAEVVIEGYSQQPTVPVEFKSTVVTFASPPGSCQPLRRGMNDDFSAPLSSPDGTHCCFASMTLRPQGI